MTSLPLFNSQKELLYTLLTVVILFLISLSIEFYNYKKITTYSLHVSTSKIVNQYNKTSKKGKTYTVLKLKNSKFTFYATSWKPTETKIGDEVEVAFYTDTINFYSYMRGFFANLKFLHVKKKYSPSFVTEYISNQHESKIAKEIYGAIFFAANISKDLRESITKWGIAHLVAISGFHLGLLSSILFFLLKPFYTFFQNRYFPYRNRHADLAFIVFILIGLYAYLIDYNPSVLRAYVMSLVAFFLFSKNIKIISFGTLFFTMSIVLILFPKLVFSVAFWFSIWGVFYIFLFLHHFSHLSKTAMFILLHFWVYILMVPIVHYVFDIFSFAQFLSPFLSMLFLLFYPLSMALHVMGLGHLLDNTLEWFFSLHVNAISLNTPLWFLCVFVVLSLVSIKYRNLSFVLILSVLSLGLGLI